MKRLIALISVIVLTFGVGILGYAASPSHEGTHYINGTNENKVPVSEVVPVRYGKAGANIPKLTSGMVVVFDTNSHDGVTISAADCSLWAISGVAGVLVTDALTDDNGKLDATDSFASMCVRGYCLAYVDTSEADAGGALVPSTNDIGYFGTGNKGIVSTDCGVLLEDNGSDAKLPVWIK